MPGSFSQAPTATTTNPDGSQTLEWNLDLSSASSSQTITWQSNVTGLEPNQSVTVADDATVQFVSGAAASTLNLPDQIVTGIGFIGISPSTQTVAPAAAASYDVTLANPTSSAVTYTLSVQGVPAGWASLAPSVTVAANQSTDVPLVLTPAAFATGSYAFNVSATAADGRSASVGASLVVQGQPVNSPGRARRRLDAHALTSHRRRRYGRAIFASGHQCRQRRRHLFASALRFAAGRHRRAEPFLNRRTTRRQQLP